MARGGNGAWAGEHILRMAIMAGALAGSLYAQEANSLTSSPGVPGGVACQEGLPPRDGFRSATPAPHGACPSRPHSADQALLGAGGLAPFTLWADRTDGAPTTQAPTTQPQASPPEQGSPKHIFGVVPSFNVSYQKHFQPLTPRQKFDEWLRGTYDPGGLGLYAAEAADLEYSSRDGFCGYGKHWGDYGRCFGSMELDANISGFLGDFLFPVVLHQDPRFFRLGSGSVRVRIFYALSRVFVTHADSGRTVFFSSALAGSVIAAAASNLYYPPKDRGFEPSLNHLAIDLGDTALFNVSAEFWPEIKHGLKRVF